MTRFQSTLMPRRFPQLMALYEDNHAAIQRLLPPLRVLQGAWQSRVAGSAPLLCRILAQERHTTVLLLTHRFPELEQPGDDPMAFIRVYHDTRQAEVTHLHEGQDLRRHFAPDVDLQGVGQRRLRLNLFLARWLEFLERCGHAAEGFRVLREAPRPLAGVPQPMPTTPDEALG